MNAKADVKEREFLDANTRNDIIDTIKIWATTQQKRLPLGAEDPMVEFIAKFMETNPIVKSNDALEVTAAMLIILMTGADSYIGACYETLSEYFAIQKLNLELIL